MTLVLYGTVVCAYRSKYDDSVVAIGVILQLYILGGDR